MLSVSVGLLIPVRIHPADPDTKTRADHILHLWRLRNSIINRVNLQYKLLIQLLVDLFHLGLSKIHVEDFFGQILDDFAAIVLINQAS